MQAALAACDLLTGLPGNCPCSVSLEALALPMHLICFARFAPIMPTLLPEERLERGLGLSEAVALNMNAMVGIGPFIVIPLVIQAMGGPQCLLADAHSGAAGGGIGRDRFFSIPDVPGSTRQISAESDFGGAGCFLDRAAVPQDFRGRTDLEILVDRRRGHDAVDDLGRSDAFLGAHGV
jgi:hypothetical protein